MDAAVVANIEIFSEASSREYKRLLRILATSVARARLFRQIDSAHARPWRGEQRGQLQQRDQRLCREVRLGDGGAVVSVDDRGDAPVRRGGWIGVKLDLRSIMRPLRLETMSSDRQLAPWSLSRRAARQCRRSTKAYPQTNQESDETASTESILHVGFSMDVR